MREDRRLLFTFATMMLCFSIGSIIMCMEVPTLSHQPKTFEEQINAKYEEKQRFWEWDLGNGYISACENATMMLSLFFGYMRCMDLFREYRRVEKERAWLWFWNLSEGNEDDNNY